MSRSGLGPRTWAILVLAMVVTLAACGSDDDAASSDDDAASGDEAVATEPAADQSPELERIVDAARQEGALNLNWTLNNAATMEPLVDAFKEAYELDIEVTVTPAPGMPANLAELVEEHNADRPASTDAYIGTQDYLLAGGPERNDIFELVDWEEFAPHTEGLTAADGAGVSLLDQIPGFAYNTQEISEDELPKTIDDVLTLQQPIASTHYAAIFNLLSAEDLLGRDRIVSYLDEFQPAGLIGCVELDRLASGEFSGMWMACGRNNVDISAAAGAPLDTAVLADAGVINSWYMAVPKHAVNPNAAKLWVGWLVTPEAQSILFEHEFADNRLVEGSRTAEQIAEYEAEGVTFAVTDYDFVLERPDVSDPEFIGELIGQLQDEG